MTFSKCHVFAHGICSSQPISSPIQICQPPKTPKKTNPPPNDHLRPYSIQIYPAIQILLSNQPQMSLRLLTTRVAGPALRLPSPSARSFTTTAPFKKTAAETAQETIQKANKKTGEAGVAAIEKGRTSFSFSPPNPRFSPSPSIPFPSNPPSLPFIITPFPTTSPYQLNKKSTDNPFL